MLEYEIERVGYHVEVRGPAAKWLHTRLVCIRGCKYVKRESKWIIPAVFEHVAAIVVRTYLNNVSKKEEETGREREAEELDEEIATTWV